VYELYCGLSSTTQNQRDPSQQSSNWMTCQDLRSPRTPNLMQLLWLAVLGKLWRHKTHTLLVLINHKKQVSQLMFFIHWCAWVVPVQVLSFKNWQKCATIHYSYTQLLKWRIRTDQCSTRAVSKRAKNLLASKVSTILASNRQKFLAT